MVLDLMGCYEKQIVVTWVSLTLLLLRAGAWIRRPGSAFTLAVLNLNCLRVVAHKFALQCLMCPIFSGWSTFLTSKSVY